MKCVFSDGQIKIDDHPVQIRSGAIHYFRTRPEQWRDRLVKLRQCGLNTVETYCAWHLHEKYEGEFDFSGILDVAAFIRLAGELGLMVMVRPGPYICSECDLGGLPGWLLGKPGMRLRCNNPQYLDAVKKYFSRLLPQLTPLQCTHGGPIIAMQVENEYGDSFCGGTAHLEKIREMLLAEKVDVQLFTSDGETPAYLYGGTLPSLPAAVNCRNNPDAAFNRLDSINTGYANPHLVMELWVGMGWHWGRTPLHHHENDVASDIRALMAGKNHFNCYMFHGGTNFGFTSGANYEPAGNQYISRLTSYEVDAILDEGGNTTPKYFAVQSVIEEFCPGSTSAPAPHAGIAYPPIEATEYVSLTASLDQLSAPIRRPLPEPMENFGQSFGLIMYTTTVHRFNSGPHRLFGMRDRAIVMLNGNPIATLYRNDPDCSFELSVTEDNSRLDILVENMGRINFAPIMDEERKGLTGCARAGITMQLEDWEIRPLPLDSVSGLNFTRQLPSSSEPGFYRGWLKVDKPEDTYLKFPRGVRGYVWINGVNIGRYWNIGPQYTLYVPRPLLHEGSNEIVIFELHGLLETRLEFSDHRLIGPMGRLVLS